MDMFRSAVLILIGYMYVVDSQIPELTSNSTFVAADDSVKLTCTHSTTSVKWWLKTVSGNDFDQVLIASKGSTCSFYPTNLPVVFVQCDCAGSTFNCTLKSVSRTNDGDKWKCSISQAGQIVYSQAITIAVADPPRTATCVIGNHFITSNNIRAVKNKSLTINCASNSNPPPMNYTWTLPDGLKHYGQHLTIPNVLSNGTYKLDVNNVMNATFAPQVIIGNANVILTVEMLFPVVVRPIANATVLQNRTLSVTCPYSEGNPTKTHFMWIHVNTSRNVGVEQTLTFQNMQITDEGFYKCRVNNTMDPTGCCSQTTFDETMFYVDVQYPAIINRFYVDGFENARSITINESQTVTLVCEYYSDPVAKMFLINNTRNKRDVLIETNNNTISASLEHLRCEFDTGIYECKGNNTHTVVQQVQDLEIIIRCAPRSSPFMPLVPKVWTKTNSSVILTYTIVAYPPPKAVSAFVWQKKVNTEWLIINQTSRINIQISQDRLQTNLSILQLQVEDFANYTVKVDNEIGSTEQTFVIQANEEPAIPQQFRVPEETITDSSVIVKWKSGLNGEGNQ